MNGPGDPRAAARAIDALRRGWPVTISGADGAVALLAIETADAARLAAFDPDGVAGILLSPGRATTLKLANQRAMTSPVAPVLVGRVPWIDLETAVALADPQLDLATPMKGPFPAVPLAAVAAAEAALLLARLAGILPAFFLLPGAAAAGDVDAGDVAAYAAPIRWRSHRARGCRWRRRSRARSWRSGRPTIRPTMSRC